MFVDRVVNVAADENIFDKILKNALPVYYLGENSYTTINNNVKRKM